MGREIVLWVSLMVRLFAFAVVVTAIAALTAFILGAILNWTF